MKPLDFHKMQAAGNDFVLLDLLATTTWSEASLSIVAERTCARRFGIGADGLLTVETPTLEAAAAGAEVRMRMWNPDGTEDMCGNGLRCVAEHAWQMAYVKSPNFTVETLAGLRKIEIVDEHLVRAAMGAPRWDLASIPMRAPEAWRRAVGYELPVEDISIPEVTSVSTGSTHTVVFLKEALDEATFARLSPAMENHPWFPERTSVLWAIPAGENAFSLRIWERGVGETLACGTGACAVAAAARVTGRANGRTALLCPGGTLTAEWNGADEIYLTGPARHVFKGTWLP